MKLKTQLLGLLTLTLFSSQTQILALSYIKNIHEIRYDFSINVFLPKYTQELKIWYKKITGKELNLDNPQTFNEKIQWLKLYDSTYLKTRLADKYLVREWVSEKIEEEYLVPLLGVWSKFDEIDFSLLPEKFVLKANHGSGWNIIVTNKNLLDKKSAKEKLDKWLKINYAFHSGYELHYSGIQPKIIAEEYLENENNDICDYKVWCFDGNPKFIQFFSDKKTSVKMAFYSLDWVKLDFVYNYTPDKKIIPCPKNLDLMLNLAKILSNGFSHVRVDFYVLNDGSIKFGEMTFTSTSGVGKWTPEEWEMNMGQLIQLPKCIKMA